MLTPRGADVAKRDRIVLNVVLAHVPLVALLGALCGKFVIGLLICGVAAALCAVAYVVARGTRAFRAYAGALLMIDSAGVIAASGGQIAMHFHVFIVLTFLILYFDWLPIVVATGTIALHHIIGDVFFPQLVFGEMATMANSWVMVVEHAIAVVCESAAAIYVALRVRASTSAVASVAATIAQQQVPAFRASIALLAQGDLTHEARFEKHRLSIDPSDEIGLMAATFEVMQDEIAESVAAFDHTRRKLHEVVLGIGVAAGKLSHASAQFSAATSAASESVETISISSEQVATSTRTQAAQLAHAGGALNELARSASQIARGANEQTSAVRGVVDEVQSFDVEIIHVAELGIALTAAADAATSEAATGTRAVVQAENAVMHVRDRAATTEKIVTSLESRSSAVGEIVSVIEEIADQTNLLALNAAIEAARAGDHGRGFAVVADEVRKLAERSATSTREIGQILSTLRRETVEAAESMRASRSDMEAGSAFAQEANAALAIVAEKIAETSRIAAEIVSGSATMRTASARATSNIEGVSAIIGHNAAAASEVDGTTGNVRDFLASIASQSNAQSAAAGEVTSSVLSLAEHVQQLGVTAEAVAAEAQRMLDIVGYFQPGADRSAAPGYPNRGYLRSSEARNSSVSGAAERLPASA